MNSINQDEIKEKLRKLFALQEGTTNENEAAAAATRTQAILDQYGLTIADIALEKTHEEIEEHSIEKDTKPIPQWRHRLLNGIALYYDCRTCSLRTRHSGYVKVMGRPSRIAQVEVYHEYLVDLIERVTKAYKRTMEYELSLITMNAEHGISRSRAAVNVLRSFREGMADRLAHRLQTRKRNEEAHGRAATENAEHTSAMMVRQASAVMRQELNHWIDANKVFSKRKKRESEYTRSRSATEHGRTAGDVASLHKQVDGAQDYKRIGQ